MMEDCKKLKPNYQYQIKSMVQVESRTSYIKSLRASALYMEENMTDEEFHECAITGKQLPEINTYKILNIDKL